MLYSVAVAARVNLYIKKYMKRTGVKQGHLAEEIGYGSRKFSQLINGRVPMHIDDLIKICYFFQVPASEFMPIIPEIV